MVFDSIPCNIDKILWRNQFATVFVFVFGDFNVYHKDRLTYSDETDSPGELCYSFSIDLTQMVSFPFPIPDYALLNLFLSSEASICSKWLSLL